MNKSDIENSCIFISQPFMLAQRFKISATEVIVMVALGALHNGSYDEIAKVSTLSTNTLRATNTSPLSRLVDEGLVEFSMLKSDKGKQMKIFQLTEEGDMVLHFLLTGKNRQEVESV